MLRILAFLTLLVSSVSVGDDIPGWINEFHYRNYQDDWKQFIEIVGPSGKEAWEYLLVMYQGRNGSQFHDGISLSGQEFEPSAAGGDFGFIVHEFHHQHGNIRKGKRNGDGLALVFNGECIQFICYGDEDKETFTATTGPCYGKTCKNIGAHEPRSTPIGHSLQMEGKGRYMQNYTWHTTPIVWTPKNVNTGQEMLSKEAYAALVSEEVVRFM